MGGGGFNGSTKFICFNLFLSGLYLFYGFYFFYKEGKIMRGGNSCAYSPPEYASTDIYSRMLQHINRSAIFKIKGG